MKTILIVDDELRITSLYSALLSDEGYKVYAANSASEAYGFIKNNRVDLILLDINMPKAGGGELYEVLRLFNCTVKVIVTSVCTPYEQKKIIKGAADYYDKSEGIDLLLYKIKEVFKNEGNKEIAGSRQ